MDDLEKAKRLIDHWIAHGREHAASYEEWAEKLQSLKGGTEMASALRAAAAKLHESVSCLMAVHHDGEKPEKASCEHHHDHAGHHHQGG